MTTERLDVRKSPCCNLPLIKMPRGGNVNQHWRCSECQAIFVVIRGAWLPCPSPEAHRALAAQKG